MLALPGPGFGPGMLFQTISTTLLHQFCILNFRISYSFSVGKFITNCRHSRAARGPPRSQPRHSRAAPAAGVAFLVHHFTLSMVRIPTYALEVSTSSWRRRRWSRHRSRNGCSSSSIVLLIINRVHIFGVLDPKPPELSL